jgi:hypothetical protein
LSACCSVVDLSLSENGALSSQEQVFTFFVVTLSVFVGVQVGDKFSVDALQGGLGNDEVRDG